MLRKTLAMNMLNFEDGRLCNMLFEIKNRDIKPSYVRVLILLLVEYAL